MISAIILAAGESKRMGQPKMLLPWGRTTVLGQVLTTFRESGIEDILVITGGAHEQVEQIVNHHKCRSVFNKNFESGEMLSSLQSGIKAQSRQVRATLVGLGDQPQIQVRSVVSICEAFRERNSKLIVPSYQRRRGHPWLIERSLWQELLGLKFPQPPRDLLNKHAGEIDYVEVNTPTILADLDTPEDYQTSLP